MKVRLFWMALYIIRSPKRLGLIFVKPRNSPRNGSPMPFGLISGLLFARATIGARIISCCSFGYRLKSSTAFLLNRISTLNGQYCVQDVFDGRHYSSSTASLN